MWKEDLELLLKVLPKGRQVVRIEEVPRGIAFIDTEGDYWYYNYNEATLTVLPDRKKRGYRMLKELRANRAETEEELEVIYDNMRELATQRGYILTRQEFREIRQQCEDEGDRLSDCSEGLLREIIESWVAAHF